MLNSDHNLKFLLDEGLPPRKKLLHLNSRSSFNVRHITHDYDKSGLTDQQILKIAEKDGRILVVLDGDFNKKRQIQKKTAILKMTGGLTIAEIDDVLFKVVQALPNQEDFIGKMIFANRKGIKIQDYLGYTKDLKFK